MTDASPTRLDPAHTRAFGMEEAHAVLFQHRSDHGGCRPCVAVMVPEGLHRLRSAMRQARALSARVLLLCDTAEQAADARARAAALLPHHREVALDRAKAGISPEGGARDHDF